MLLTRDPRHIAEMSDDEVMKMIAVAVAQGITIKKAVAGVMEALCQQATAHLAAVQERFPGEPRFRN